MTVSRREFIKQAAAVSAAVAVGIQVPREALAAVQAAERGWRWDR